MLLPSTTSLLFLTLLVQGPPVAQALSQAEYDSLLSNVTEWYFSDPVGMQNLPGAVRLG